METIFAAIELVIGLWLCTILLLYSRVATKVLFLSMSSIDLMSRLVELETILTYISANAK